MHVVDLNALFLSIWTGFVYFCTVRIRENHDLLHDECVTLYVTIELAPFYHKYQVKFF